IHHKKHYHLVFKEVCQPIHNLKRLDIMFKTLMDVHKALELLHSIGWVHCDISTGKVLCWGKMGKLGDLEHAKSMDSNMTHEVHAFIDMLKGMMEFMASKVEAQKYLFQRHTDELFTPVECLFNFNPLHDMESLWWIAMWILYYHVDQKGGWPSSEQITEFYELFPGRFKSRCFMMFCDPLNISKTALFLQNVFTHHTTTFASIIMRIGLEGVTYILIAP
ncbi:hypothetical protein PISMIDRAFT_640669, partial [Pisolithus microcarpus 441]